MVGAVRRLERDGTEFRKIDAAVRAENAFIDADVDDSADDVAVLVDPDQLALERDRQLVDQRRVDKFALCDVEAGLFHLLRLRIGGDHAHVVGGDDVRRIRKADRKGALLADVRRGSVACAQAELHLVGVIEAAPRGVHRIRGAVRIVGGDDQHRQRVEPRFHTKTLSHSKHSFYSIQLLLSRHALISGRRPGEPSPHSASAFRACWCSSASSDPSRRSSPSPRRSGRNRTGRSSRGCGRGSWSRG